MKEETTFPAAAMSWLSAMLTAVPSLASTGEVLKLVDAIVAMLEEESRPPQDESDADGGDDIDKMRVMTAIAVVTVKPRNKVRLQQGMLLKRVIQITLIN